MKKTYVLIGVIVFAAMLGVGAAAFIPSPFGGFGMMGQFSDSYGMMGDVSNQYPGGYGMMGQSPDGYSRSYGMMDSGMMGQNSNGYNQRYSMMEDGVKCTGEYGYGMMNQGANGYGQGYGMMDGGMMGGSWTATDPNAPRISLDEALDAAKVYAGSDFDVLEIMEFDQNFYVIFVEPDTGRGAFEVLVDPVSGAVYPEPGPNMMWNLKYGHMGSYAGDNTISLGEAYEYAQTSLDANWENAEIEGEGASFYGYYTFDYAVDGEMVGMLSINGVDGQAFYHTWHGDFVQEEEHE